MGTHIRTGMGIMIYTILRIVVTRVEGEKQTEMERELLPICIVLLKRIKTSIIH